MVDGSESVTRLASAMADHFGPVLEYIEDPDMEDIHANSDGRVWLARRGQKSQACLLLSSHRILTIIQSVAAWNRTVCNASQPMIEGVLPFRGARFAGVIPPVASDGPLFSIRLRPRVIHDLDSYVNAGALEIQHMTMLCAAMENNRNVLVAGGTGSGKTTFLNACVAYLAMARPDDRIVCIQDTAELQCSSENVVALLSDEHHSMDDCLRTTLRLKPKRIIVGEVRGREALAMLDAWSTGHPGGLASIHANDAAGAVMRLEELVRRATSADVRAQICATIHMVVFIAEDHTCAAGRRVKQVCSIEGFRDNRWVVEDV